MFPTYEQFLLAPSASFAVDPAAAPLPLWWSLGWALAGSVVVSFTLILA